MDDTVSVRRSIWVSGLITLVALVIFIGVSAVIPQPQRPGPLLLTGIFLALIPAVIWLVFFAQRDHTEPEPKRLVLRMFLFGALAATATSLLTQIFDHNIGELTNPWVRLVLTILAISLLEEAMKMSMVRYVLLGTNEFDDYPDGIVYGLASGMGFATVLTLAFVLRTEGVIPLAGAIHGVNNALVHGVLGAVGGYYIGRVKFDGKKLGWLLEGLAIVSVLNGVYKLADSELSARFAFNPIYSLGTALALALVTGAVLFAFFRRALLRARGDLSTVSEQIHGRSLDMPWDIHIRYDYLLWSSLVLACMIGFGVGAVWQSRTISYTGSEIPASFEYPAGWAVAASGSGELSLEDLRSSTGFRTRINIASNKVRAGSDMDLLVAQEVASYRATRTLYSAVGDEESITVSGSPAVQIEYRYAAQTPSGPVLVQGRAVYVLSGSRLYIIRVEANPDLYAESLLRHRQIVQSFELRDQE